MASGSHMAFARNRAGQVIAANDLPAVGPARFHYASCGGEVALYRQNASLAYFRHVRPVACEQGALRALHTAALQLLAESRFVAAPAPTQPGNGHRKRRMIKMGRGVRARPGRWNPGRLLCRDTGRTANHPDRH
jgi:hypothetical protein